MCARSLSFLPSFVPFPPKASGSSLLAKITHYLVADALGQAGLLDLGAVTVLPLATGMALTMTLLALNSMGRGDEEEHVAGRDGVSSIGRMAACRRVLWSRIDQKTCLKAITAAGLEPEVIELLPRGDELVTDVEVGESWSSTCLDLPHAVPR
jgi:O-phospho-L-seryl-tRNASec:L-selenocysteinyl-tRNA synthase